MTTVKSKIDPNLILCSYSLTSDSREVLSDEKDILQVSIIPIPAGKSTQPHSHIETYRMTCGTQECWVVLSGLLIIKIYDLDDFFITSVSLPAGSVFVTFAGGHSLTADVDTKIVEIKNGPYYGREKDYRVLDV